VRTAAAVATALVALLHVWFLVLEMFLWVQALPACVALGLVLA